ncbi:hypothetical protein V8E53_012333 [Lactarius tabidus]
MSDGPPRISDQEEPVPTGFIITSADAAILQDYLDDFEHADAAARATIVERAMAQLYMLRPPHTPFHKVDAAKKIRKWFYNRIDPPRCQYTKFTRRWATRSIFHQLNRDEIIELAKETSGLIPGHPQFLGALQNATTALWNALAPDDRDDYCKAAKEWSDDMPPKHIQSRMAQSMCKRVIQDFQKQLYKICSVQTIVLSAYQDENNKLALGMDDLHSLTDEGILFKNFCPNWKMSVLWKEWTAFGVKFISNGCLTPHLYTHSNRKTDQVALPPQKGGPKTNTEHIPIILEESGCPIRPDIRMDNMNKTKRVQSMLRDYCLAHICKCLCIIFLMSANILFAGFTTGRKKTFIPWSKLVKDPSSFISKDCTPEGFEWKDPSKIRIGEVFHLLYHWRSRQDEGLLPLVWVPTSSLFQDEDEPSGHHQGVRRYIGHGSHDSDEENFDLPSFGEYGDDNDTDHVGGYDSVNEPEDNSSGGREPNDQSAEDHLEYDGNQGKDTGNNSSESGEPNDMNKHDSPMHESYNHQSFSDPDDAGTSMSSQGHY